MEGALLSTRDITCPKCKSTKITLHDTTTVNRHLNFPISETTINFKCPDCSHVVTAYIAVVNRHLEVILHE